MENTKTTKEKAKRRATRIRAKIFGTARKPRLSIFRSNKYVYGQLIDDEAGRTLASVSGRALKIKGKKTDQAAALGKSLGEAAKKAGIGQAIFDKGSYKYHGRIRAFADGARSAGLKV